MAGRIERAQRARSIGGSEAGQAIVLSLVWLVVLLGMAGLVIDVGSWFRSQRSLQAQADASALAGAQELPNDTVAASSQAQSYATKNGIALPAAGISFQSDYTPNDSITVKLDNTAPTFFTKLFGLTTVKVSAQATARDSLMGSAKYVAPIAVNIKHPLLSGAGCPCFHTDTTLPLGKTGAPGAFALIDFDGKGTTGASDLAGWINNGYQDYLNLGDYFSNTGAKWNSVEIEAAMTKRLGTVLMFPVYDTLTGSGVNALYHVIAWVGFRVDSFTAGGVSGSITGQFTDITWEGLPANPNSGEPNLGASVITLTH